MVIALGFEFEGLDLGDVTVPRTAAASARLVEAADAWTKRAWAPYAAKKNPSRTLRFNATLPGPDGKPYESADITLVADADLFLQLSELAVDLGATGMTAALKALANAKGSLTPTTLALFLSAHDAVERFLADELARAEAQASAHALVEAQAIRDANERHRRRFEKRAFMNVTTRVLLLPGDRKRELFSLLVVARRHHRRILHLQAEMSARDRKDGATSDARTKARKRDEYRRLLFEIYAGPHRAETAALEAVQRDIFDIYPTALAIIGDVGEDLADWLPPESAPPERKLAMVRIEEKYDTLLWETLQAQSEVVGTIERSLGNRSVATWAEDYFRLDAADRQDAGSLAGYLIARLLAPAPGVAAALGEVATRGTVFGVLGFLGKRDAALAQNHVLARTRLLTRMVEATADQPSTLLDATLVGTFLRDLQRAERIAVIEGRASDMVWQRIEIALALASLLVGLVSLPFGAGEAILPASLGWLAALVTGALLVGTIVLLVRTVMTALNAGLAVNGVIRDRLIAIGQENPEALEELAGFITGRRALVATLAQAVVEELIELAAQRLLPPLAFALDLRDHYQAMDSLTESVFETTQADEPSPAGVD